VSFFLTNSFFEGDSFLELKHKSFHLCDEFSYNADTQSLLVRHGEILMSALNYFISTLDTLCNKTIEDTVTTIRLYEMSRFDRKLFFL